MTRNVEHPVMVFDREGGFLTSFGQGHFSNRTHGAFAGPDDSLYFTDDGTHTITKFTPDGELLLTLGIAGKPSKLWGGEPFNRPTHAAVSPNTGHIFVSDGYGNSRVHKYTADGELLMSWGESGVDAGQFMRPHNIAIDGEDRVYVADRECHRVQVFDADGGFITMWNNIHRPDGMTIGPDGNIYYWRAERHAGSGGSARAGPPGQHSEPRGGVPGAVRRSGAGRKRRASSSLPTGSRWTPTAIFTSAKCPTRYSVPSRIRQGRSGACRSCARSADHAGLSHGPKCLTK